MWKYIHLFCEYFNRMLVSSFSFLYPTALCFILRSFIFVLCMLVCNSFFLFAEPRSHGVEVLLRIYGNLFRAAPRKLSFAWWILINLDWKVTSILGHRLSPVSSLYIALRALYYLPGFALQMLRPKAFGPAFCLIVLSAFGFAHYQGYSLGAKGGCGGKAAKLPAPPTASQRKYFYGAGAPEGPRCHMNDGPPWGGPEMNDGSAIRLQGIRGLWHKGPY